MGNHNTLVWVLVLLAGVAAAALVLLAVDSPSATTSETIHLDTDHGHDENRSATITRSSSEIDGDSAVILMDAFHWGWVPQVLKSAPGVKIVVGTGAQGSEIHVPMGMQVQLILRNAGGNSRLHRIYEERFHDYFTEKYGEAWEIMHQASHGGLANEEEAHHEDSHENGEGAHEDAHQDDNPMMQHTFLLETYNLQAELNNDPENNIRYVEFTADQPGEFRFRCVNFCGIGHDAMQGVFKILEMD